MSCAICRVQLTVFYYHVTYAFQKKYRLCSCVNVNKWLSVRLQNKWWWIWMPLSLKLQMSPLFRVRSSLTTIECRFTLKNVCDMIITCISINKKIKSYRVLHKLSINVVIVTKNLFQKQVKISISKNTNNK